MRALVLAAATAVLSVGCAEAGGFAPVGTVRAVPVPATTVTPGPVPLEWLRQVGPRMGRDVLVQAGGVLVPGIEWHRDVQVRVRTKTGALLGPLEQATVRDQALICRQGEVRNAMTRVEPNGTFVVDYDCAWLQGS